MKNLDFLIGTFKSYYFINSCFNIKENWEFKNLPEADQKYVLDEIKADYLGELK